MSTDVNFTPIEEGDDVNAASLATPLAAVEAGVNDLPGYALPDGALRSDHLSAKLGEIAGITAAQQVQDYDGAALHFTNSKPGYGLSTYVGDGPGAGAGWRSINVAATGQIVFTAPIKLGMGRTNRIAGLLCLGNVYLSKVYFENNVGPSAFACLALTWLWQDGAGNWHNSGKWERITEQEIELLDATNTLVRVDCPMRTLITDTETGANDVAAVTIGVAFYDESGGAAAGHVYITRYNMSVLPLHAEVP